MPCWASRSTWCSSAAAPTDGSRICKAAAQILKGRKVAPGVRLLIVPGSQADQARSRSGRVYADIFKAAGADWRESGCSMCLGMNGDTVAAGPIFDQHQQPQFRGPPRRRRAHPAGQPVHRGGKRRQGPDHRSAGDAVMEPVTSHALQDRGDPLEQYRHRSDHSRRDF